MSCPQQDRQTPTGPSNAFPVCGALSIQFPVVYRAVSECVQTENIENFLYPCVYHPLHLVYIIEQTLANWTFITVIMMYVYSS